MILIVVMTFITSCDFNPLGGTKSNLDPTFEPGKHTPSAPPVIGAISDFIIDENDVQTIPFTINDPDTFMVCSLVFVKATSSNNTVIDSSGLTVGGTYPNCTLTIAPKSFQFGVVDITVTLYDFWTYARSNFQLTVVHILTPGAFAITDAEGQNQAVDVTWQNAAYMLTTGAFTSPYYTIFYRPSYTTGAWSSVARVVSPYTVTGLTNGVEYDFYVLAHNSIGNRQSNTVQATPTKYQIRGAAFVPSGTMSSDATLITQYDVTDGSATAVQVINATMTTEEPEVDVNYPTLAYSALPAAPVPINDPAPVAGVDAGSTLTTPSGKYKVYLNSQGNILSGVGQ